MAAEGSSSAQGLAVAGTAGRPPGTLRAIQVLLRVLAVLVFAQPVFAGLLLDGNESWREWHSLNGEAVIPLLTLVVLVLTVVAWRAGHAPGWMPVASVAVLATLVVQIIMGDTSNLAIHVPLGVAILGGIGTLINRTRTLTGER
jgi:hypothetical protein